jgi:hypothetical protein
MVSLDGCKVIAIATTSIFYVFKAVLIFKILSICSTGIIFAFSATLEAGGPGCS